MGNQGTGAVVEASQVHLFFKGLQVGDFLVVAFYGSPTAPNVLVKQGPWVCWKPKAGGEQIGCWLNPFGDRGELPKNAGMDQLFTLAAMAIKAWEQGIALSDLTFKDPLCVTAQLNHLTSLMALLGADVDDAEDDLVEHQLSVLHSIILEVQALKLE